MGQKGAAEMAEAGQGWHSLSHRMAGGPMQQAWVSDPRPAELDSAWAGPSWQPHHCGSQIPNWSTALMAALQGLGGGHVGAMPFGKLIDVCISTASLVLGHRMPRVPDTYSPYSPPRSLWSWAPAQPVTTALGFTCHLYSRDI